GGVLPTLEHLAAARRPAFLGQQHDLLAVGLLRLLGRAKTGDQQKSRQHRRGVRSPHRSAPPSPRPAIVAKSFRTLRPRLFIGCAEVAASGGKGDCANCEGEDGEGVWTESVEFLERPAVALV